jgi:hypothetical protein
MCYPAHGHWSSKKLATKVEDIWQNIVSHFNCVFTPIFCEQCSEPTIIDSSQNNGTRNENRPAILVALRGLSVQDLYISRRLHLA